MCVRVVLVPRIEIPQDCFRCLFVLRSFIYSQKLTHRLQDPLGNLSELVPYVSQLRHTKVEFISFETVSDDDGMESAKDLFAALPSLKTFDYQRMNDGAEDGFHRFRRDKLEEEPEWIEEESTSEWDQQWTGSEAGSGEVEE